MQQTRKIKPTKFSVSGSLAYRGKRVQYESILERDFISYYAFCNDVINIVPQPITIAFIKHGRKYHYTPDFFIDFDHSSQIKPIIAEVKPRCKWQKHWRQWSDKWKEMISYCKDNGYQFHIYDESRIYHQAFKNIKFLARYQRVSFHTSEWKAIENLLRLHHVLTIDELKVALNTLIESSQIERLIFHLLYIKRLDFDVWGDLNSTTKVWLNIDNLKILS